MTTDFLISPLQYANALVSVSDGTRIKAGERLRHPVLLTNINSTTVELYVYAWNNSVEFMN